jgi:polyisoprenoid-binding protein YceI
MKHFITRLIFAVFSLSLFFSLPAHAADTYTLDPNHTYVMWHINHFGFSNPSGKWMAQGTLVLDETNPQNSQVNVTINVADIVTGIPKLDEHLKTDTFFNVAQFPTATFVSTSVREKYCGSSWHINSTWCF